MSSPKQTIALSFFDHKKASLFFDKVFPMHSLDEIPRNIRDFHFKVPNFPDDKFKIELLKRMVRLVENISSAPYDKLVFHKDDVDLFLLLINELYRNRRNLLFPKGKKDGTLDIETARILTGSLAYDLLRDASCNVVPVFKNYKHQKDFFSTNEWIFSHEKRIEKALHESLQINVKNLKMVVTHKSEWKQIEEIRNDKESIGKLRNLRLLFHNNYKGKNPDYIKDDIDKRIEEYEDATRKHGFELKNHIITSFLDPKSLVGVASVAAISSLVGGTAAASVAAIIGATIHTSKVFFEIKKKKFEFAQDKRNNEIAYIMDAKKILSAKK